MRSTPAFRAIGAPLDVNDAALDLINQRLGVPTLAPARPPTKVKSKAINLHLPDYVVDALKAKAFTAQSSVRFVIMQALADAGIRIDPADLIKDARRT